MMTVRVSWPIQPMRLKHWWEYSFSDQTCIGAFSLKKKYKYEYLPYDFYIYICRGVLSLGHCITILCNKVLCCLSRAVLAWMVRPLESAHI
jgi:hypothetical protein